MNTKNDNHNVTIQPQMTASGPPEALEGGVSQANGPSQTPRSALPDAPSSAVPRRLTGKVARLPRHLREMVNHLLDDGHTYMQIVKRLEELGHPGFFHQNIQRWKSHGYQRWLRQQEERELRLKSHQPPGPPLQESGKVTRQEKDQVIRTV